MLSKWTAWDFIRSRPHILSAAGGLQGFFISDSYIEHFFLSRLKKELSQGEKMLLLGNELSLSWVEDNLMTLSLFGGQDPIIVLHADEIPSPVLEAWEKNPPDLSGRALFLFFRKGGKNSSFDQWSKKTEGEFHKIEDPTFWQSQELFNFICQEMQISVSYEVKEYLLSSLDHETPLFVSSLEIIKHSSEDPAKMTREQVRELIPEARFDKFKMASALCSKDHKNFWSKAKDLESDQVRELFNFLHGHLLKVACPDLLVGKSRESKYGKEILTHSKMWKGAELVPLVRACAELEVAAKASKNSFWKERVRRAYLKSLFR